MVGYIIAFLVCLVFSFFLVNAIAGYILTYRKHKGSNLRVQRDGEYAGFTIMLIIALMIGAVIFA